MNFKITDNFQRKSLVSATIKQTVLSILLCNCILAVLVHISEGACVEEGISTVSEFSVPLNSTSNPNAPIAMQNSQSLFHLNASLLGPAEQSYRAGHTLSMQLRMLDKDGRVFHCARGTQLDVQLNDLSGNMLHASNFTFDGGQTIASVLLSKRATNVRMAVSIVNVGPAGIMCNRCGDGFIQDDEICDDGNDIAGDGCHNCRVEPGFVCSTQCSSFPQTSNCTRLTSCEVISQLLPGAQDGQYSIIPFANASQVVGVACTGLGTGSPKTFLNLQAAEDKYVRNVATFGSGGHRTGVPPTAAFSQVRLLQHDSRLYIDATDQSSASVNQHANLCSSGCSWQCQGEGCKTALPLYFAAALGCRYSSATFLHGHARADLSATPLAFANSATFTAAGASPSGSVLYSSDRRRAEVFGDGGCGYFYPTSQTIAGQTVNHALELVYIGHASPQPSNVACSRNGSLCVGTFDHMWLFGGSSGSIVRPVIGNVYPEQTHALISVVQSPPSAFFPGSSNVKLTSNYSHQFAVPSDGLTLAAVVTPSGSGGNYQGYLDVMHATGSELAGFNFGHHANPLRFWLSVRTSGSASLTTIETTGTCSFTDGQIATVVATVGHGSAKLFVNGTLCAQTSVSGTIVMPSGNQDWSARIGGFFDDDEAIYMTGSVSLVGYDTNVWNDQDIARFSETAYPFVLGSS